MALDCSDERDLKVNEGLKDSDKPRDAVYCFMTFVTLPLSFMAIEVFRLIRSKVF